MGSIALYMRMLDGFIDIAARLAGSFGASHLDVRPAQRTLLLDDKHGKSAEKLGLVRASGQVFEGTNWLSVR